ncbi:MAG: O-antigen ligase family protein [Rhodospirillales bacterium]
MIDDGEGQGSAAGAGWYAEAVRQDSARVWLVTAGGLICALGLLMGRWSPARLLDYQAWDDIPWYLDLRLPLVVCGLIIVGAIKDSRPTELRLPPQLTLSVAFMVIALLGFTLTASVGGIECHTDYCGQKTTDVIWLICFLFIAFCLALEPGFEDQFYLWVFLLAMVLALTGLRGAMTTVTAGSMGVTALEGGRNVFSRILGVLAILALYYYLGARNNVLRVAMIATFGLSLGLMVLTGSRGGTAASLCGLAVAAVLFRAPMRGMLAIGFAVLIAGTVAVELGMLDTFAKYVTDRYISRVFGQLYLSGRDTLFWDGIGMWLDHPVMGAGLGRFSEFSAMAYPHNFFVELLAEAGIIGFALLLVPLGCILNVIRRNWSTVDKRGMAIFALYAVAAQASGDIYDSRALILLPVIAACGAVIRQAAPAITAPPQEHPAGSAA